MNWPLISQAELDIILPDTELLAVVMATRREDREVFLARLKHAEDERKWTAWFPVRVRGTWLASI